MATEAPARGRRARGRGATRSPPRSPRGSRGEPQLRWQGMPSDGDSRTAYAALGEAGWIGLHWPEAARRRAASRRCTPSPARSASATTGCRSPATCSRSRRSATRSRASPSPALQERLLPEVAAGRLLFCQGFSEPDAGSDLAALRTTARDDGDRFVVSGRKLWTSSAEYADWIYLAVRTGARPRHRGLSVLVAPIDTPGITVSDARDARRRHDRRGRARGRRDPARPARRRRCDGGWSVLMGTLDHERVTSEKVGVVLWLLDRARRARRGARAERARLLRLRGEAEAARDARPPRRAAARRGPARRGAELDGQARGRAADAARRRRGGRASSGRRRCSRRARRRCTAASPPSTARRWRRRSPAAPPRSSGS